MIRLTALDALSGTAWTSGMRAGVDGSVELARLLFQFQVRQSR